MFKMALDLTPPDRELCSQSTISRLENLPDARALLRMGRAMVDLYCGSFHKVPVNPQTFSTPNAGAPPATTGCVAIARNAKAITRKPHFAPSECQRAA
jgi:hypothetical protein